MIVSEAEAAFCATRIGRWAAIGVFWGTSRVASGLSSSTDDGSFPFMRGTVAGRGDRQAAKSQISVELRDFSLGEDAPVHPVRADGGDANQISSRRNRDRATGGAPSRQATRLWPRTCC